MPEIVYYLDLVRHNFTEQKRRQSIGVLASGMDLGISFTTVSWGLSGPNIYLQSGIHGGEVTQWILRDLYTFCKKHLFKGTITFVSVANPMSWMQRTYFSTNGKFDFYMGRDWNGNYPGSANGSLGERIADALFQVASKQDLVIDLHTSRNSIPFNIVMRDEDLNLAQSSLIKYTQFLDINAVDKAKEYRKTLNGALSFAGVPSICIECGSHDSYEPKHNLMVEKSIKHLLGNLGVVKKTEYKDNSLSRVVFNRLETYSSPNGGLMQYLVRPGDRLVKGQVIANLLHPIELDNQLAIFAREPGIVLKLSPTHIYNPGDELAQVITDKEIKKLD